MRVEQTSTMVSQTEHWELWRSDRHGYRGAAARPWTVRRKADGKCFGHDTKRDAMAQIGWCEARIGD